MEERAPWRDFNPYDEWADVDVSQHLADMRFVHNTKKHILEPANVTQRLMPYRKMRETDPTRFLTEMMKLERELAERVDADIARAEAEERKRTGKNKEVNADTAHCLALVERKITEWHAANPGSLEMKP